MESEDCSGAQATSNRGFSILNQPIEKTNPQESHAAIELLYNKQRLLDIARQSFSKKPPCLAKFIVKLSTSHFLYHPNDESVHPHPLKTIYTRTVYIIAPTICKQGLRGSARVKLLLFCGNFPYQGGCYGSCLISRYFLHQPFRQTKHIHMTYFVGCSWVADNMTIPCDTTTLYATASRPSSTSAPPSPLLTCHTETPAMIKNTKIVNTVPSTSVQNATEGFCKRKRANMRQT